MGHAARAGKVPPEQSEDNRNGENQYDQHRPCPQAVVARHQRRQRRYGKHAGT